MCRSDITSSSGGSPHTRPTASHASVAYSAPSGNSYIACCLSPIAKSFITFVFMFWSTCRTIFS
jgi:hypothetical protein